MERIHNTDDESAENMPHISLDWHPSEKAKLLLFNLPLAYEIVKSDSFANEFVVDHEIRIEKYVRLGN